MQLVPPLQRHQGQGVLLRLSSVPLKWSNCGEKGHRQFTPLLSANQARGSVTMGRTPTSHGECEAPGNMMPNATTLVALAVHRPCLEVDAWSSIPLFIFIMPFAKD